MHLFSFDLEITVHNDIIHINSQVLVVKTHEWGPNAWTPYGRAILLIRDPEKSILAEFNRQSGGHVGFASPDRYRRTKGRCMWQY